VHNTIALLWQEVMDALGARTKTWHCISAI
jgi:hypothetical protein